MTGIIVTMDKICHRGSRGGFYVTWDNYIIRVAGSFGGQKFFSRKSAVAEVLKHIQMSLRDVRHLPDDDVTPFSFAQR